MIFSLKNRFNTFLPGPSVKIEVMDYNDILADELLGETQIDIGNRFYSKKFRSL